MTEKAQSSASFTSHTGVRQIPAPLFDRSMNSSIRDFVFLRRVVVEGGRSVNGVSVVVTTTTGLTGGGI